MKKFFCLLPAVAMVFSACSDSDDDKGPGSEGGEIKVKSSQIIDAPDSDELDEVRLVIYGKSEYIADKCEWDGGFALDFPETVPGTQLTTLFDLFDMDEEEYAALTISNPDAGVATGNIVGYRANSLVGVFIRAKFSTTQETEVGYIFSDSPVSVKGTYKYTYGNGQYSETFTYNLNLKKGWNTVAAIHEDEGDDYTWTVTMSIPSGLSWYFEEYD